VAALALVTGVLVGLMPLLAASAAAAATSNGTLTVSPLAGSSSIGFSLSFADASAAACPGDSATDGYRVQSFVVPNTQDLSTLTFSSVGPTVGQPLIGSDGNALVNGLTEITTGYVLQLPGVFTFAYNSPGDLSPGAYFVGLACTLGTGLGMTRSYWAMPLTITSNPSTGGPAQMDWSFGSRPAAPAFESVTPGGDALTVVFSSTVPAAPPVMTYTLTAVPQLDGTSTTQTGAASPITMTGLTPGVTYSLALSATNALGTGPTSVTSGTLTSCVTCSSPLGLTAASGVRTVTLSWTAPVGAAQLAYYQLLVTPAGGSPTGSALSAARTSFDALGLVPGTLYTFELIPIYSTPGVVGTPAVVFASPMADQVLVQDITVTRPVGALVLTQVCGAFGALPADPTSTGFPTGLPAAVAVNGSTVAAPTAGGTAPTLGAGGTGGADPVRSQYPYPTNPDGTANPTYPTHCGIDLGNAQFVRSGAGAGQFFAASGRLNQVTVVDTRDGDLGWNVVGQVSNFSAGGGKSFSGSELGWTPVNTEDTGPFTDSLGNTYDQLTAAGGAIAPNTLVASGLSSNRTLISAPAFHATGAATSTGGLGTAIADARLKLLIPITAQSGTYTATLTISSL